MLRSWASSAGSRILFGYSYVHMMLTDGPGRGRTESTGAAAGPAQSPG
jgi:hypothetical protein